MKKNLHPLQSIGLSAQAELTYTTLVGTPPLSVSELARRTNQHRVEVYRALSELESYQLVTETITNKQRRYAAENPERLEHVLEAQRTQLSATITNLKARYTSQTEHPTVRTFAGKEGIEYVYELLLQNGKRGDIIYRYESPQDHAQVSKFYPKLYWELATRRNKTGKAQIQKFVITNDQTQQRRSPRLERFSKAIPRAFDVFDYDITQIIYGDSVAFIDFKTKTASLIQSSRFAHFQRQLFKLLFSKIS